MMEEKRCAAFRLLTVTFGLSLLGLLWGLVFMLNATQDNTDMIRRIEQVAKVEIRYTLYKGAHHDLYLTADRPPASKSNMEQNNEQAEYILLNSRKSSIQSINFNLFYRSKNNFSNKYMYTANVPSNLRPFLISLAEKDMAILSNLLTVFLEISSQKNLSYVLHGGSLLGSYRHHGLIPWDTDIDLWVNIKDKEKLIDAISELGSKYEYVLHYDRLIFYEEHTSPVKNRPWKFPYINISFYKCKGNKVVDSDETAAENFSFPEHWIFPPVFRPFWGRMLATPRNSASVIQRNYNISLCETKKYNHKQGNPHNFHVSVFCHVLYRYLPFVFRKSSAGLNLEELKVGTRVLQAFLMP